MSPSILHRTAKLILLFVTSWSLSCIPPEPPSVVPSLPAFNHVMLYVSDIEASIAFYNQAFDIETEKRISQLLIENESGGVDTATVNMAFLKLPGSGFVLELAQNEQVSESEATAARYQHIGIDVENIETSYEQALQAGAQAISPVRTVYADDIKAKNAFFTGPDGERIELMQILNGTF